MDQPRTSMVFQAPEEMTDKRNSESGDEERRLHILQSMAKLEGNPTPAVAQTSPINKVNSPLHPTVNQPKPPSNPHQFALAPHPTTPQIFAPTPIPVPYFFYPSFAPNTMANMQPHINTYSMYPLMNSGSLVPMNPTLPPQQSRNQESRLSRPKQTSTLPGTPRHRTTNNDTMKTPEKSGRLRASVPSTESSPESNLKTPPNSNPAWKQYQHRLTAEPTEIRQQRHPERRSLKQPGEDHAKTRHPSERQSHHKHLENTVNENYGTLINSGTYGLQLESKKTGVKLVEKKRLTINEMKLLQALPPLPPPPPRPELQRSSLSSSSNLSSPSHKKKQDKFAWFDYYSRICRFSSIFALYKRVTHRTD
ncbi:hypothetical protein PGTUg99_018935 [Puccinia graminis f. sp. tritici]|uniref:Uncharacterized protein n=1 Tax=Puccinia graminis f. sp. tritici TaxID=56615 RepID=A0A5B0Q0W2_PUCGR|nr:hypothetical protein PGTUg99_018935 [Puccinia graminis f. sp. tritici]